MMEKLTKERMAELWSNGGGFITMLNDAWEAIQSHTDAIREETQAEVLRDHFRIGEDIVYDSARDGSTRKGFIWINDKEESSLSKTSVVEFSHNARRPPKKRAMTREEKIEKVRSRLTVVWNPSDVPQDHQINDIMKILGLPTETDE
jgi:hypothetical protein